MLDVKKKIVMIVNKLIENKHQKMQKKNYCQPTKY